MRFFRPLPVIKAISFDLDDTLYDNHPIIMEAEKGLRALLAKHYPRAAQYDRQAMHSVKAALIAKDDRLASDMGELRKQTLYQILKEDVHGRALDEAVAHCFDTFYRLRSDFEIDKTIHSCLNKLAECVPLAAITNGNVDIDAIGLRPYFKSILHASLQYRRKPYPDMFNETVNRLGVPGQHILHVGDGMTNDVYGAYKAGFSTAWLAVNRPMNLKNENVKALPNIQLSTLSQLVDIVDRV